MRDAEQLGVVMEELIDVLHLQAKELEEFATRLEQVTPRLGYMPQFSVTAAKLSELHLRMQKLKQPHPVP